MTPRIPLSRCKRCVHYRRETCQLPDLNPCNFVETAESKDRRFRTRYGLWNTAIVIVLLILLLVLNGCRKKPEPQFVPKWSAVELLRGQRHELSPWEKLQMAIIWTESKGNPDAVGSNNDGGLYQMLPVYVEEVNRVCGTDYTHSDVFDPDKAIEIFNAMQGHYNPGKDFDTALHYHNRSAAYKKRVLENYELICRMEEVRSKLIKK